MGWWVHAPTVTLSSVLSRTFSKHNQAPNSTQFVMIWGYTIIDKGYRIGLKVCIAGSQRNPVSQLYGTSSAIWVHTELPATRHKWTRPALTPASQPILDLPRLYPGEREGWVDLSNPAMQRSEIEFASSPSQVRRPNHYTTESPGFC